MNGWAEDAMREAIDYLSRARRNDLASDLNRIFKSMRFDDLDIMRSSDADLVADRIYEAETIADLTDCLREIVRIMKVEHGTLHVAIEAIPESFSTKVITTYPKEWIEFYVNRAYYKIDPVMSASKTRRDAFYWDTLDFIGPLVKNFWRDSESHGIGATGYTVPILTSSGNILALSISSTKRPEVFRDLISPYESDLYNLGIILVEAFGQLASEDRPATFNLTDDQLIVLRGVAMGADEDVLATRNYLFGSYGTISKSICLQFRTKTVAQAAVLATRLGLLENLPLTVGDIMAAGNFSSARSFPREDGLVSRQSKRISRAECASGETESAGDIEKQG